VVYNKVDSALRGDVRAYLSHGRQLTEESKALDFVARNIRQLRRPFFRSPR
jgi:hypothetical protein